jgi:hypothetical protein
VEHVECLVGALDQVEIRLGGNTFSVTDFRQRLIPSTSFTVIWLPKP